MQLQAHIWTNVSCLVTDPYIEWIMHYLRQGSTSQTALTTDHGGPHSTVIPNDRFYTNEVHWYPFSKHTVEW